MPDPIADALSDYVYSATWPEARRVLEAHPELLTEQCVRRLSRAADAQRRDGEDELAHIFEQCRDQLQRCLELGIRRAFEGPEADAGAVDAPRTSHDRVEAAFAAFLMSDPDWPQRRALLEACPELTTVAVEPLLDRVFAGLEASGSSLAEEPLRHHARLLRRCREVGVEAAFAESEGGVSAFFPATVLGIRTDVEALLRRGDDQSLDAAAARVRELLADERSMRSHPAVPAFVLDLAGRVAWQQYRLGDLGRLDEAVARWREAVDATAPGAAERAARFSNLGNALQRRFLAYESRAHRERDIGEAIALHREAVALSREDLTAHRGGPLPLIARLSNLGLALRVRAESGTLADARAELEDLSGSIDAFEEALGHLESRGGGDHGYGSAIRANAGVSLNARFLRLRQADDLDRAIELHREASASSTEGSYELPSALNNLATALKDRHDVSHRRDDLDEAVGAFRRSYALGLHHAPDAALKAARNWGAWAMSRRVWPEAAEAYGYGLQAMLDLFRMQAARVHKETWLSEALELPARCATARAHVGDLTGAVLALEQGRALLLSEVLERQRAELGRLADAGHADRARRFRRAAHRLSDREDAISARS